MAPEGFEPPTSTLRRVRSVHLSYGAITIPIVPERAYRAYNDMQKWKSTKGGGALSSLFQSLHSFIEPLQVLVGHVHDRLIHEGV